MNAQLNPTAHAKLRDILTENNCYGYVLEQELIRWHEETIEASKSFSEKIIGTGDKETDAGIEKAYKHANPEWVEMALAVVRRACETMPEWSVNDIRDEIYASPIKTHSNYAMGGVMGAAKKNGWITQARNADGTARKVMNTVGHLTTVQVWKSLIYKGSEVSSNQTA